MKPYARALFLSNTAAERVDRFELCHQRRDIAKFRSRSHDALIRVYDEAATSTRASSKVVNKKPPRAET